MADKSLTPKQAQFVLEYLVDLNATQAAIRAGYSTRNADKIASQLLGKTRVRREVDKAIAARAKRVGVSADRVVRELARIAFCDPRNVFDWGPDGVTPKSASELSDDDAACVAEATETKTKDGGTIRIKLADKIAALNLLAKHTGVAKDHLELSGPGGIPISTEVVIVSHQAVAADENATVGSGEGGESADDSGQLPRRSD